ncbi:MAG TPA: lytic transglycosylase domain-containing protein [Streptosporangiaceae bacterium]|jgi:hypothetical protein
MVIAAGGLAVVTAGTAAAVTVWPAGASVGAATTAAFVPGAGHGASAMKASHPVDQFLSLRSKQAWQARLTAAAQAQRAEAARRAAAARKAAARKAAARRAAALAAEAQQAQQKAAAPQRASAPPAPPVHASGSAQQIAMSMLASYGWSSSQFSCLDPLWMRESGWSVTAENPDGAYGIPQAMPGSKMASAGADWATEAATQIRWGLGYIKAIYGSPCGAWSHEEATGWY